ncbi:NAD(P)H dehydrogenase (quinone) [Afipia sp. P52-10]|jgi:multimeric flavodoxin WrbA|uniref:flavodoxin family protein n=1 Tax=Afipia sp. P52-10 TaxID=1429916 RepID=UPI0003DEF970|nr:flavodoxin family protein [Afipia sp. P52-10]ETR78557.1 NAD(P)H dehydrogenase (quinone) [Afipia sp. P52-10]
MRVYVLSSSPRRDGNSAALATAAAEGLREAGDDVELAYVDDIVSSFLRDCRQCRDLNGSCTIADRFGEAFTRSFLPSDGFIVATPIYWYGMSGQLKAFFDRMFCYVAASNPRSASVKTAMQGKRVGLLMSSEETYPTVSMAVLHQIQEYCRYTRSTLVGVVHGHGNSRGDIMREPSDPVTAARQFGRTFASAHASDYHIDTERSARMWC